MAEQYFQALEQYFKLKSMYETKLCDRKHNILSDDELSIREKRKRIQNIRMKCIGCKRLVGTIFTNENRKYSAVCGDKTSPCKLDISLQKGEILNSKNSITETRNTIKEIENNIITIKLDLLFGLIDEDEMMEHFEELKQEHKENVQFNSTLKTHLRMNLTTEERKIKIRELLGENIILLSDHKELLQEYLKDENVGTLTDLTELYINEIIPNFTEISKTKYPYRHIGPCFNDETKKCLIQKTDLIELYELIIEDPKIVSFILK